MYAPLAPSSSLCTAPLPVLLQPVTADSVIVMVTGRIILEGQENPLGFSQVRGAQQQRCGDPTLTLVPLLQCFVVSAAGGSPFVSNEFFRFSYGVWIRVGWPRCCCCTYGHAPLSCALMNHEHACPFLPAG